MHAEIQSVPRPAQRDTTRKRIVVALLFALIIFLVLSVLWPTTRAMIEIWQHSSAYGHCYVVIPVAIWMAWRESSAIAHAPPQPYWPGIALIAAIGFAWLVGEVATAAVVSQFAAIGIVAATALTVLGIGWARTLAFPLGFLFFAVPFGEGPTADLDGLDRRRHGGGVAGHGYSRLSRRQFFRVVPSGSWSVVEACSGVRFLIAALMTSSLFAWLQYRTPTKRISFVLLVRDESIVNVYLGLCRGQRQGSEVVNALNQVARSGSTRWRVIQRGTVEVRLNGNPTSVKTAVVRGVDGELLIWHWYWVAGHASSSDVEVKLRLAWQRLTGEMDTAAWVAVYTPLGDDVGAGARRLTAFFETMSGSMDDALVAMSK